MQKVYFGVTQSGQQGLFTNGMLAWPLDSRGVYNFFADPHGFCEKLGFRLDDKRYWRHGPAF